MKTIIIVRYSHGGYGYIGPFADRDQAHAWIKRMNFGGDYELADMVPPIMLAINEGVENGL
jgi:hypothetical protein